VFGLDDADGILGWAQSVQSHFEHWLNPVGYSIGPTNLTKGAVIVFQLSLVAHAAISGSLFPANTSIIPTVTDNLYNNGDITRYMIGIYFQPSNVIDTMNGEITWGQSPFPWTNKYSCSLFDFRRNRFPQVDWEGQFCVWSHLSFTMTWRSRQISVLVALLRGPNSIGALISPFATATLPPSWRKLLVSLTLVKKFPSSFLLSNQAQRGNS